uniref:hypothetical protein n=1 Tax=unclassified Streptomyces TaxID=2593676 RepID=UPI003F490DF1
MDTGKRNVVVWLDEESANALGAMAEANVDAQNEWLAEQRAALGVQDGDPTPEDVRLEMMALRPDNWPGESLLLESAMRRRLALPDLAGPWVPLTERELAIQRLPGRRIGTPTQKFDRKLAFDLDPHLVLQALTAAYRVSEPVVTALIRENLVGPRPRRSREALARKRALQADIYTLGRIVREAICLITP